MSRRLLVKSQTWPLAGQFTISRGTSTNVTVVTAEIVDTGRRGRGECKPTEHYGESKQDVMGAIYEIAPQIEAGLTREELQLLMPAGSARNALDCALWDLEAKLSGEPVAETLGMVPLVPKVTAYTLSLGSPEDMAAAAERNQHRPLLKVKLGGAGDPDRIAAVRRNAPDAMLIVDANEAWSPADIEPNMAACHAAGVALVEQPLPAGDDEILRDIDRLVPICADESVHVAGDVDGLVGKYDAVNIKLDKTGGLTAALNLLEQAEEAGLTIMVGCMVATSLSMAPATFIAQRAKFVDLDGPLLLAADRQPGLVYRDGQVYPPDPDFWG